MCDQSFLVSVLRRGSLSIYRNVGGHFTHGVGDPEHHEANDRISCTTSTIPRFFYSLHNSPIRAPAGPELFRVSWIIQVRPKVGGLTAIVEVCTG